MKQKIDYNRTNVLLKKFKKQEMTSEEKNELVDLLGQIQKSKTKNDHWGSLLALGHLKQIKKSRNFSRNLIR